MEMTRLDGAIAVRSAKKEDTEREPAENGPSRFKRMLFAMCRPMSVFSTFPTSPVELYLSP